MANCIVCSDVFELTSRIFEQRLIEDTDFCPRCFGDIMKGDYDEDLLYDLQKIAT